MPMPLHEKLIFAAAFIDSMAASRSPSPTRAASDAANAVRSFRFVYEQRKQLGDNQSLVEEFAATDA